MQFSSEKPVSSDKLMKSWSQGHWQLLFRCFKHFHQKTFWSWAFAFLKSTITLSISSHSLWNLLTQWQMSLGGFLPSFCAIDVKILLKRFAIFFSFAVSVLSILELYLSLVFTFIMYIMNLMPLQTLLWICFVVFKERLIFFFTNT